MLDLYFLRLSVYKAGQGEYRLSKSFATDSFAQSPAPFLLIRAFSLFRNRFLKSVSSIFSIFFFLIGSMHLRHEQCSAGESKN